MNGNASDSQTGVEQARNDLREVRTPSLPPAFASAKLPIDWSPPALRQPVQPKIEALVQYLIQNLNRPVSVTTLSALAELSPSALFLSFKRATGQPPIAFLIQARMKLATKLLEETNLQIKQIAAAVGYPDEFHFSRRFKSAIGMAPRNYRLSIQKKRSEFQNRARG